MNPDSFYGSICFRGQFKVSLERSGIHLLEKLSFPRLSVTATKPSAGGFVSGLHPAVAAAVCRRRPVSGFTEWCGAPCQFTYSRHL